MDEREKFAQKKLEECKTKPVLFTVKTSISYRGNIDDDAPISGKVLRLNFDMALISCLLYSDNFRQ